ncbi:aldehyde dehydrogenase family protein [Halobellus captivus]|uniref:aldehyde dehydrogenase family protein n=1 Tax=Halobellus captivus TaxID=2592614 RepID=UPI001939872E|nr:aldehyde dehydrogenase [Halobellus captivus]
MALREQSEHYQHFINGEFVESTGDTRIDVEFPYNGEIWGSVPHGTKEDVDQAVNAAKKAFREWRRTTISERYDYLHSIADALDDHAEELGELETRQNGKLIREMQGQASGFGGTLRHYASLIDSDRGEVIPVNTKDEGMFNYVVHEPYGVVGAITPWNSPLLLTVGKLGAALAAGNTFVHKPSEQTPVSALRMAEIITEETNLPKGVYNVVTGHGDTGAALVDNEDVDKLAFTGSSSTGRSIAESAGRNLSPVTLELGGKSPNIMFPSAELENAVTGAVKGIFAATGQTCVAGSRVLVHEEIYDEFVDRFVDRASQIRLGDPREPETEMGPIAFDKQWEKVRKYIDIGTSEGATIAYGGDRPDDLPGDCFIEPTIFVDVDNEMTIARDEIFGPVAAVIQFSDEEEAIEIANDTRYGLAAGVWTEDMRQAQRVANQIDAGTVWINEYRTGATRAPIGGFKDSGLGREGGKEGLDEYRQEKCIYIDQTGEVANPFQLR